MKESLPVTQALISKAIFRPEPRATAIVGRPVKTYTKLLTEDTGLQLEDHG